MSVSHRCKRGTMGGPATRAPPARVASWGTRAKAQEPPLCHQWHFLCQQDRVSVADAPQRVWTVGDGLRLLSPLAACRGLDAGHGYAAPMGTPKPGSLARTIGVL